MGNLSHQANYLGKFADALHLARAAQSATVGVASPTVLASFLAMEARALASAGDARQCAAILNQAEAVYGQRVAGGDPDWVSYFDQAELAGEAAHCFRDLGRGDETRSFASLAVEPAGTPARTRAFLGMVDAMGAMHGGHLDEALALATLAVETAGPLRSRRYVRYVEDFRGAVSTQHPNDVRVREFHRLVAEHLGSVAQS